MIEIVLDGFRVERQIGGIVSVGDLALVGLGDGGLTAYERSQRFAFFDMGMGWGLNASYIVREVASIPDSLINWFYGEKRHEEGKAFGC